MKSKYILFAAVAALVLGSIIADQTAILNSLGAINQVIAFGIVSVLVVVLAIFTKRTALVWAGIVFAIVMVLLKLFSTGLLRVDDEFYRFLIIIELVLPITVTYLAFANKQTQLGWINLLLTVTTIINLAMLFIPQSTNGSTLVNIMFYLYILLVLASSLLLVWISMAFRIANTWARYLSILLPAASLTLLIFMFSPQNLTITVASFSCLLITIAGMTVILGSKGGYLAVAGMLFPLMLQMQLFFSVNQTNPWIPWVSWITNLIAYVVIAFHIANQKWSNATTDGEQTSNIQG